MSQTQPFAGSAHLPAEWEAHAATWLVWPQNRADWPGKFTPVAWVYCEIVRRLSESEPVRILVNDGKVEQRARRNLVKAGTVMDNVFFEHIVTDRGWARDMFPVFVKNNGQTVMVRFGFNAWAKYNDFSHDAEVPQGLHRILGHPMVDVMSHGRRVVMEGGGLDTNGRGVLLTTEECLLDPVIQIRNKGFTRADYEEVFRQWLGIDQVVWLPGGIAGDDTHGHVDDVCRFVATDTVVLCSEPNQADANYSVLKRNREVLEGVSLTNGGRLQIVDLPMPEPLFFDGQRLPASYANFYIANTCVIVPTFNDANDRTALGILSELFPDRTVVGIHAVDLVLGLGTVHCLTHEEPL